MKSSTKAGHRTDDQPGEHSIVDGPHDWTRRFIPAERILLQSILPIVCSAAIGFAFYRWLVFNPRFPTFQFAFTPMVASVYYYSVMDLHRRDTYAVLLVLVLLTLLATGSSRLMWVLRDCVDFLGVILAVEYYARLIRKSPMLQGHYFGFVFSGILGIFSIASWSLQFVLVRYLFGSHQPISYWSIVSMSGFRGFMVGLGVGVGILLNRRIFGTPRYTDTGNEGANIRNIARL